MREDKINVISFSAIMMGIFASFALMITCGLLAIALFMTFGREGLSPPLGLIVLGGIAMALAFIGSFFVAAYVANICAPIITKRSVTFNSVGTWSLMSIIVSIVCLCALLAVNVSKIDAPYFVTDVHITKLSAVTRIDFPKDDEKEIAEKKQNVAFKNLIAWFSFAVISLGFGSSLAGGRSAMRRQYLE